MAEEMKAIIEEESKILNIFQRMSLITAEISAVAKNLSVGEGRSSYKAVGEADVLAAVRPIEAKHGVYSYPVEREIVESAVLTSTSEYKGNVKEVKKQFLRLRVTYRFVNIDKPSDYIDIITYGDGVDTLDKAPGKSMTYADKYALLKAYKIITGDDPDQKMSEEFNAVAETKISDKEATILANTLTDNQKQWVRETYKCEISELTKKQYGNIMTQINQRKNDGKQG